MMRIKVAKTGAAAALLCLIGCSEPERPGVVPPEATRVEGPKTGYWQICRLNAGIQIHCTVWNDAGTVLKDETYLPLDEGPTPREGDLRIRAGEICSGPYQVCLINGRILLPASQFEQLKDLMMKYWRKRDGEKAGKR